MRRHEALILILILTIVAAWGMIPQAYGQEKAKPEGAPKEPAGLSIARVAIGTGVERSEPVAAAETFPSSAEQVYCFVEAKDIGQDAEITLVWIYGSKEMLKTTLPLKKGPRWRTYASKNLRGLKGDWKVEVRDASGNVLKEVKFKVE